MRRIVLLLATVVSSPMAVLLILVAIDPGGPGPTGGGALLMPVALAASGVAVGGLLAEGLAVSVLARRIGRAERAIGGSGRFASRAERNRARALPVIRVGVLMVGLAWLIGPRVGGLGRAAVVSVAVGYQFPALLVGLASVLGQWVLLSGLRAERGRVADRPPLVSR